MPDGSRSAATASFGERFGALGVVNAPMATVAGGALAAAVAGAGGVGLIGGGYGDHDWILEQRRVARELLGDRHEVADSIGVGLITWRLGQRPWLVSALLEAGVRTFFFSFGDPQQYLAQVAAAGGRSLVQVQDYDEARQVVDAGADAVVVQGTEAGGHGRHNQGVDALGQHVVACVGDDVPVLAAGGITTADDVARVVGWGASGVVVGTRLYATDEALDCTAAKQRLIDAAADDAVRTSVFELVRGLSWPAGFDGRALRNALVEQWERDPASLQRDARASASAYSVAAASGDMTLRAVWAGTGVGRIADVRPAAEIVNELAAGLSRQETGSRR